MLTVGINEGMLIHQMDVKNACLNGTLDEPFYLRAPQGLSVPAGHCLKLKKLIYGLKQAPRIWYRDLLAFFKSIDFEPSPSDPCLFTSTCPSWRCFVHVYVDDMVIVRKDVSRFKQLISARYAMEDLGQVSSLLGMKISQSNNNLTLSQQAYAMRLLKEYDLVDSRTVPTPMVPSTRLPATEADCQEFLNLRVDYRHAVGSVNYLAVSTQADIAFAVSQLSQHLENPGASHWRAFLHLLRSISGTKHYLLRIGGGCSTPQIFTDADYANCTVGRRSYSGYLARWGHSVISWKSHKQTTVSSFDNGS